MKRLVLIGLMGILLCGCEEEWKRKSRETNSKLQEMETKLDECDRLLKAKQKLLDAEGNILEWQSLDLKLQALALELERPGRTAEESQALQLRFSELLGEMNRLRNMIPSK